MAGVCVRDPPQDSGTWGTNNRAIAAIYSISQINSLSRVNPKVSGYCLFIKLSVGDGYLQALLFPR